MKRQWSMIGAIVLLLLVAILSVLNVDSVPLSFGFAIVEWPLIIIIFVSFLLGAVLATLLSTIKSYKDKKEHGKETKPASKPLSRSDKNDKNKELK